MAEKDTGETDETSLELPSLFGRKNKKKNKPAEPEPTPEPASATPAPAPTPAEETTVIEPVAAPVAERPAPPPVAEPTQQLPPAAAAPEPVAARATEPTRSSRSVKEEEPAFDGSPEGGARKAPKPKREAPTLPTLRASIAALVVGAVIGLLGVGLTFGSLQACDAITGTDSCGGPGLLVVLVVVVVMIMAGSALLRGFGVPEPGGLSFLGVAIFVALCLVFLLEQLLEPWMVAVGPALCCLSFGTAHWIVNRFNTELLAEETAEPHDVR